MGFINHTSIVEEGHMVTIYIGYKNIYVQTIERGAVFQTKFGALRHDDIIGTRFGSKVQLKAGYVHVLSTCPELWTLTLPHRTQILYATDISLITSLLYLMPGSKVVEAGTGSGSLSHSIIRTIAPTGHLYTFDFHQERVEMANQEFKEHSLDHLVTCTQADVCSLGFDLKGPAEVRADAVFLDLPHPWECIESANRVLKRNGGRICCFSPCMEQVQKTVDALRENLFTDVVTNECVLRPFEVRHLALKRLGFPTPHQSGAVAVDGQTEDEKTTAETPTTMPADEQSNTTICATKEFVTVQPTVQIAGHTGFLTFATKLI